MSTFADTGAWYLTYVTFDGTELAYTERVAITCPDIRQDTLDRWFRISAKSYRGYDGKTHPHSPKLVYEETP